MTLTISYQALGVAQALAGIAKIVRGLQNPQSGLEGATHAIAKIFAQNFEGEGSLVGGWDDLSEYTQRIREWQGFDPEKPILFRYGSLRKIAVDFFESARMGEVASHGADFPARTWSDQQVTGSLTMHQGNSGSTATLQIQGSYKILNQFGHGNAFGYSDNPARPYWFVNPATGQAARDAIIQWVKDEVI